MAFRITLSDDQWDLVADLFDPPSRRGAPARIDRRSMVDAMLFLVTRQNSKSAGSSD